MTGKRLSRVALGVIGNGQVSCAWLCLKILLDYIRPFLAMASLKSYRVWRAHPASRKGAGLSAKRRRAVSRPLCGQGLAFLNDYSHNTLKAFTEHSSLFYFPYASCRACKQRAATPRKGRSRTYAGDKKRREPTS